MYKSIKSVNLSQEIVQQFLNLMINKKLKAGDKIPSEMKLTKEFNVSRGVIREAMKSLEIFGLITIKPGHGTFVNKFGFDVFLKKLTPLLFIDKNEVIDLLEIRKILETYGVRLAVQKADKEDIKLLENELLEMNKNLKNHEAFIQHDVNFHVLLNKSSGNSLLSKIIETIRAYYLQQSINVISKPGAAKRALNFHKEILEAVKNKNKKTASKILLEHLEDVERAMLS
jgi:GntR family transcriptional repressor for pyruvate dehydrogenase complex